MLSKADHLTGIVDNGLTAQDPKTKDRYFRELSCKCTVEELQEEDPHRLRSPGLLRERIPIQQPLGRGQKYLPPDEEEDIDFILYNFDVILLIKM
ncbi:hypothetical protein AMTR_s00074p00193600 [Amborella trichopoda]|uniref:Uncharacterized protein n=1 Tax=Amborella trichopoda TaxID=13333 RepID=W1NN23_AMBTC|nr:hypothetical protein AMTR_s00074p00193600 [Amborella trichopoda]